MVTGWYPFKDKIEQRLRHKICNEKFKIPKYISEGLRDLLTKILEKDSEKRYTISQITKHSWFAGDDFKEYHGYVLGRDLVDPHESLLKKVQSLG